MRANDGLEGRLALRMGLPRGAAAGWHLGGSERASCWVSEILVAAYETSMPELPKIPTLANF